MVLFATIWLAGIGSFVVMVLAHNGGTAIPTATHAIPFTQHGNTKFITPAEQLHIDVLLRVLVIGGGTELVLGLFLWLGLGIRPFGEPGGGGKGA